MDKEISVLVEKPERAKRSGNAQVTDKQFDQLENRHTEIDRLFLENSMIKAQDRMIHLRDHIKKSGLELGMMKSGKRIGRGQGQGWLS